MCGTIDPGSCIWWALSFGIKIGYDTLLDEGSAPVVPDEDNPTSTDATAPKAGEDNGTYKTSSKWVIPVTLSADTHSLQVRMYQRKIGLWRWAGRCPGSRSYWTTFRMGYSIWMSVWATLYPTWVGERGGYQWPRGAAHRRHSSERTILSATRPQG
jgi:hypothetical protein